MNDRTPYSGYHRRALGTLATDLMQARDEREQKAALALHKDCAVCQFIRRAGCTGPCDQGRRPEKCPSDCGNHMAANAEQPAPLRVRTWLAEDSNAMAAMLPPSLWQRLKTKLRLFCDGWIDPTVRS